MSTKETLASDFDWFGTELNGLHLPLYYYFLDEDMIKQNKDDAKVLGHCPTIINALYTPFINSGNLNLYKIPYDQDRFGSINAQDPNTKPFCNVYRIFTEKNGLEFTLGNLKQYDTNPNATYKHWSNESKLQQFPFRYINITDYMNTPLMIKPHLLADYNNEICVNQTVSDKCTYNIYVKGYKGDMLGQNEGMISQTPLDLPTSSSQYAQFMATSKASFLNNNIVAQGQESLNKRATNYNNVKSNMDSVNKLIGTVVTANILGASSAGANVAYTQDMNKLAKDQNNHDTQARISDSISRINDMLSSPRNVKLGSSDAINGRDNSRRKLESITYMPTEQVLNRLCDYFTMYGYKQNKLMSVNTKSRKYFNFVRLISVNINARSVPKGDVEKIINIYKNGITFWHTGLDKVNMFDYSKDNKEI